MEERVLENGMIGRDFRHALLKRAADVNSFDDPECQNLEGKSAELRWWWFLMEYPRCNAMPYQQLLPLPCGLICLPTLLPLTLLLLFTAWDC